MTETASGYLDLHLEVARFFQRPEIEDLSKALKLLYNHSPQAGYLLLHTFPEKAFPFATEEEWNEWGRELKVINPQAMAKYVDANGEERVVYSVINTEGKPIPEFPTHNGPPEIDDDKFNEIFTWLDSLREADGIKIVIHPFLRDGGGYNQTTNTITIPGAATKQDQIWAYTQAYIATLDMKSTHTLDREESNEYYTVLNTCTYKVLKDRGYDTGEYGLGAILASAETFDVYLDMEVEIEEILKYFEELE